MRTAGAPEGSREATRLSYDQHLEDALKGKGPQDDPPRHRALYGALATWYKVRGLRVSEVSIWGELAPFLLLPEAVAREALAEYTLYLEEREGWFGRGSAGTRVMWLRELINAALRRAPTGGGSPRSMAILAVMNRVAWYDLLDPEVKAPLDQEVARIRRSLAGESQM
jgi:hypothetical protein